MKQFLSLGILLIMVLNVQSQNQYVVSGSTHLRNGIAILNDYVHPDTVKIVNGKFEFRGEVAKPKLISIQVPPSRSTRFILEPGNSTVSHDTVKGYRMGGSPNNIRFQQIEDQIKPFNEEISALTAIYNKAGDHEKLAAWRECEKARKKKMDKVRELVLADKGYAGFVEMLPIHMNESAANLKIYLDAFSMFSDDRMYQYVSDHYKGAAKTDIGVTPPDWTRPDEKGKMITLSSLKGKYVLVDFWYSGCYWCRKMTPHLKKIYSELKDKGFEIVSVSVDPVKDEDKWRKAMEEDGAPWLQAWDSEKLLPDQYSVKGYPTMFFLGPDGKVLRKIIGYHDEPVLREFFTSHIK